MRESKWKDATGRWRAVLLPDDAPESDAPLGMVIGPPDVDSLGLPEPIAMRLHNALFNRRIFTTRQAERHPDDILACIREACAVSVQDVVALYQEGAILPPAE